MTQFKKTRIISNDKLSANIYSMICEEKNNIKAGQFYMLRSLSGLSFLPRPISICEKNDSTIRFLYAVVGKGTAEMSHLKANDEIELTGPLGNGFELIDYSHKKIALVTGGIGIAPMLEVSKRLVNMAAKIDLYAGFRDSTFLIDELKNYVNEVKISTDCGTYGHHGFVTDIFNPEGYDQVLCCGPEIMMQKVVSMCKNSSTPIFISMEKHMACGVGACLACTCKTKDGLKRSCADGPVFDGYSVIF